MMRNITTPSMSLYSHLNCHFFKRMCFLPDANLKIIVSNKIFFISATFAVVVSFYKHYVDDIFIMIHSLHLIKMFKLIINCEPLCISTSWKPFDSLVCEILNRKRYDFKNKD